MPVPELITGDLDSCRQESLDFFNTSTVIKTPDQGTFSIELPFFINLIALVCLIVDATDFTKCLMLLEPYIQELQLDSIVSICETSGRIDQIHANENSE